MKVTYFIILLISELILDTLLIRLLIEDYQCCKMWFCSNNVEYISKTEIITIYCIYYFALLL